MTFVSLIDKYSLVHHLKMQQPGVRDVMALKIYFAKSRKALQPFYCDRRVSCTVMAESNNDHFPEELVTYVTAGAIPRHLVFPGRASARPSCH